MKKYDLYKDSGVEWIGDIPKHWNLTRMKFTPKEGRDSFIDGDWIESKDLSDSGIRYLTSGNIGQGMYKEQGGGFISEDTFSNLNCTEIFPDDLVISRLFLPVGRSCIIPNLGFRIITCVDNVILRPKDEYNKHFLNYYFNSEPYYKWNELISRGTTLTRISRTMLGNNPVVVPPLPEQHQIVKYLDEKTTIIDTLIDKTQQKIDTLKELRTSLINKVVTKGLDPNVEMKDSGVEWIGEIPKHWVIVPLKYVFTSGKDSIKTGPFGSQLQSSDYVSEGIKVYNQRTVYDENFIQNELYVDYDKFQQLSGFEVFSEDILITSRGTIGRCTIVPDEIERGILHPCLIRIRINDNLLNKNYLKRYINDSSIFIETVKLESNSTTIDVIYSDTLKNLQFPLPPLSEQQQIVNYFDEQTQLIDTSIQKEQLRIEKLKEYRQSLISDVVTGKIKVI